MAGDLPDPAPAWKLQTSHTYITRTGQVNRTISTVYTHLAGNTITTTVEDGPLGGQTETNLAGHQGARDGGADRLLALRAQHFKWVWRVVNADLTHPEFFLPKPRKKALTR